MCELDKKVGTLGTLSTVESKLLDFICYSAADDFGSDDEDNDFGEEEDEDGGSDYEEKRGKKAKKAKVEKPSKRGPKRKRAAGKSLSWSCLNSGNSASLLLKERAYRPLQITSHLCL